MKNGFFFRFATKNFLIIIVLFFHVGRFLIKFDYVPEPIYPTLNISFVESNGAVVVPLRLK